MNRYILREYGSWGVAVLSYLAGLSAAGRAGAGAAAAFAAVVLYVNSKSALMQCLRNKGRDFRKSLALFLVQVAIATFLAVAAVQQTVTAVLPFLILPAAYLLLLRLRGEHFILTEVAGFFLLAVSAPLAELSASGNMDGRLYLAVAIFFTAGVFKVRVQFTRRNAYRILMAAYTAFAASIYHFLDLPLIALVPLAENLVFAATLYRVKLRITGWLEVAKGALFVAIIAAFYGVH